MNTLRRHPYAAALIAGLITPLAFEPFGWYPLLLPALACLFLVWLHAPLRATLAAGFLFGLGMFGAGVSWVYVSLQEFGNMPVPLAAVCVAGFVAILALFPLAAGALQYLFRGRHAVVRLAVAMPTGWVAVEIVRNHFLTGFSWLQSGYAVAGTPWDAWAPLAGVHGTGLVVTLAAGLIAAVVVARRGGRRTAAIALVVVVASGPLLSTLEWTRVGGEPVRAALVQASVPLDTKWDPQTGNQVARDYFELSRTAAGVDIVIWPESALPFFIDQMGERFYRELLTLDAPLLAGFLERQPTETGFDYYNAAILFDEPPHLYRKRHLVPFGEYTPLQSLFAPLIAYFEVPMSVIEPWREPQQPIPVAGVPAAVSICYEDAFPQDIRPQAEAARLLINITEDAWFGDSLGPHQRLQMAQMRAREVGRPMFRASNTGLAAAIDHRGRLVAVSPQFTKMVLEVELEPRTGATPYVRFGDLPVWLVLVAMFAAAIAWRGPPRSDQEQGGETEHREEADHVGDGG